MLLEGKFSSTPDLGQHYKGFAREHETSPGFGINAWFLTNLILAKVDAYCHCYATLSSTRMASKQRN